MSGENDLDTGLNAAPKSKPATSFVCGPLSSSELAWLRQQKKQVYIRAEEMRQERLAAANSKSQG